MTVGAAYSHSMPRIALLVVPLLLAAGTAGCTSSPAPTDSTPAPTASASPSLSASLSPEADDTAGVAQAYCAAVDDFIAATKAALNDPLTADPKALQRQSEELREQAEALPGELIDDPEAITQVQECTQKLQQFNASQ